jgi:Uma2 family endonuclease
MSLLQSDVLYTPEEYLTLERQTVERHEYLDGLVYAMAGESLEHSTIGSNINASLNYQLRGKPCRVLQPNMKVRTRLATDQTPTGLFSHPDCLVVCGEPIFHDVHLDVLINAKVIIEVLSRSTEAYDRGEKFSRYRQMESFTDYLLVSQTRPSIEHFTKQANGDWILHIEAAPGNSIVISSIGCSLHLAEVYDRINFADVPPHGPLPM